jgi:hypothetical protein
MHDFNRNLRKEIVSNREFDPKEANRLALIALDKKD